MSGAATVTLTWQEVILAGTVGVRRRVEGLRRGLPAPYGEPGDAWAVDVVGALAECAVAKFLDRFWAAAVAVQGREEGDAGPVQVRATTRRQGCLILHERDRADAEFVLAIVDGATVTLAGWMRGGDGKRPEFWDATKPRPAFFVPQDKLRVMRDLALEHGRAP